MVVKALTMGGSFRGVKRPIKEPYKGSKSRGTKWLFDGYFRLSTWVPPGWWMVATFGPMAERHRAPAEER